MAFHEKAWSDEKVMKEWIGQQWCNGEMLLVLDVHRAQKTELILHLFKENKTLVFVPPGDVQFE